MKICIVSDSHDRSDALAAAISGARTAGAQVVIHCGDLKALGGEIFLQQLAQSGIIIHHQYVFAFHVSTITEAYGVRQGRGQVQIVL